MVGAKGFWDDTVEMPENCRKVEGYGAKSPVPVKKNGFLKSRSREKGFWAKDARPNIFSSPNV